MDNLIFKNKDIYLSNFAELSHKSNNLSKLRLLELSEIVNYAVGYCKSLLDDGLNVYEIFSLLEQNIDFSASKLNLSENDSSTKNQREYTLVSDKINFCDLFVKKMNETDRNLSEVDFLPCKKTGQRFSYVRNQFSDEAFDVFSQDFESPTVSYKTSFKECINSVLDGESDFCLLPLEESSGVRIATVSDLIYKNDLKVYSVTPVFGYDGNADLKYALISKYFNVPTKVKGDDRYLEIRFEPSSKTALADLISASAIYSKSIYRINTVTEENENGSKTYFCIVFRDDGGEFTSLLTYLTLFAPDFVPIGVYKNLE